MAAQQPPPDWVAYDAARTNLDAAGTQLAQGLQAAANIPADLKTMMSELKQLEHQPTNAALQQQVQQLQQQVQQFQQQVQQQFQQVQQQFQQSQQQAQQQTSAL